VTRLWNDILSATARAGRSGALVSMPTRPVVVDEGGIPFIVHLTVLQKEKNRQTRILAGATSNPFLPPDPELEVGVISPTHVCVLNKFNVVPHHLLIVTRAFEPQDSPLTVADFHALARCLADVDGLGFYNAGTVAGASQPHKHLQLVPVPLGFGPEATPLDLAISPTTAPGAVATLPVLPFAHAFIPLDGSRLTARRAPELHACYRAALAAAGLRDRGEPYNLLLTRGWMLVVPRSRECWHGISINALGFAGSLLARTTDELERIRASGPLAVLRSVV
jgi:ATP adenylyltransferase